MGCLCPSSAPSFKTIKDNCKSIEEVQRKLVENGMESSNLIIGIDYTKSNEYTGKTSFSGRSLHDVNLMNPYMEVISIMGKTLEAFDDDKIIPTFGFGDVYTTNVSVFPFYPDKAPIGFEEVLQRYKEITPGIEMSGPTNFAPLINEAIKIVRETHNSYHILVICTDGQVNNEAETVKAIIEATNYPLSIICVGVGDGPWANMHEFDDRIPKRRFDNFQFVEFTALKRYAGNNFDAVFALNALMEVPEQYKLIKKLNLLGKGGSA